MYYIQYLCSNKCTHLLLYTAFPSCIHTVTSESIQALFLILCSFHIKWIKNFKLLTPTFDIVWSNKQVENWLGCPLIQYFVQLKQDLQL